MLFKTKLNCMFVKVLCYKRKVIITISDDPLFMLTIEIFLELFTPGIVLQSILRFFFLIARVSTFNRMRSRTKLE